MPDSLASAEGRMPGRSVAEREFRFTRADFVAIAAALRAEAGISLPDGKAPLVYARLAKRLRTLELSSFRDYTALLAGPAGIEERRQLVTALTTNVTRFFREPHHFDHLREAVLPPLLLEAGRKGARVRLWSAACSTGQEAYSIAAVVTDLLPEAASLDLKVLATDIDPVVLDQARSGRYGSIEGVPAGLQRWFERDGECWSAHRSLRALLSFKPLNLTGTWPMRGPFDAVFCRNVAIYFDPSVQARLWSAFADVIEPGGTLYIGHSERVGGPAAAVFKNVGVTTYRRGRLGE
jgi:chemotaxis protein methyltransferase CheR